MCVIIVSDTSHGNLPETSKQIAMIINIVFLFSFRLESTGPPSGSTSDITSHTTQLTKTDDSDGLEVSGLGDQKIIEVR